MHKDYKLRREEIVRQLVAKQFARTEKDGSSGAYVHELRKKPYALIYAERMRERNELGRQTAEKAQDT